MSRARSWASSEQRPEPRSLLFPPKPCIRSSRCSRSLLDLVAYMFVLCFIAGARARHPGKGKVLTDPACTTLLFVCHICCLVSSFHRPAVIIDCRAWPFQSEWMRSHGGMLGLGLSFLRTRDTGLVRSRPLKPLAFDPRRANARRG